MDNCKIYGIVQEESPLVGNVGFPKCIYYDDYEGNYEVTPTKETQVLSTDGLLMTDDITINPIPNEYIIPTGKLEITENGNDIDVTEYASVDVDVNPPLQSKNIFPTESEQTLTADSEYYGLDEVKVGAISSDYVGSSVPRRDESDLSVNGAIVNVPSGYYGSDESKSVAIGAEGTPIATKGDVINHSVEVVPSVENTEGYILGGTKTGQGVIVSASDLVDGTKEISIVQNGVRVEDVTNYASAEITTNVPQIQEIAIRPDAEIFQSWTYDKHIVADEGITIPAYTTTNQVLITSRQIDEITADVDHYRYCVTARSLVIPEYNTTNTARGRFEWSSMIASHGFVFTPMAELHPLVDGEYNIATNSAAAQGGASYRGLYFTSTTGISVYTTTSYGIWTSYAAPTYVVGKIRVNSPSFTMRGQPNILDQPFWEAITDIRFQYVIELWRAPIDSLGYRGWQEQQSVDKALGCLYSANHKLT